MTGIYDVIRELVITWKEPDAQTGCDVARSTSCEQKACQMLKLAVRFEALCTKLLFNHHVYLIGYFSLMSSGYFSNNGWLIVV